MKRVRTVVLLAAVASLALSFAAGCSKGGTGSVDYSNAVTVGVSAIKADPDKYLGPVTITGKAANVYPAEGVIEIADAKACCALYLFVPFTDDQNEKLQAPSLYEGQYPAKGSDIAATGVLSKVDNGYNLVVAKIATGDQLLIGTK